VETLQYSTTITTPQKKVDRGQLQILTAKHTASLQLLCTAGGNQAKLDARGGGTKMLGISLCGSLRGVARFLVNYVTAFLVGLTARMVCNIKIVTAPCTSPPELRSAEVSQSSTAPGRRRACNSIRASTTACRGVQDRYIA
jgi:hypothetical protein